MANTTFNGPVRSENGFTVISKNSTTGAVTTEFTLDGNGLQVTPVALADTTAISLTATAHGGRTSVVPALSANCTLTLPSPSAGVFFKLVYGGAAEETENLIIDTGSDTNFYLGGIVHLDSNADNVSYWRKIQPIGISGDIRKAQMCLLSLTSHNGMGAKAPLYFGDIQWLMQ